jgi:hypothetical protein
MRRNWGLPDVEEFRRFQNDDPLLCRVIAKLLGVVHRACIVKLRFQVCKHFHEILMHAAFKRTYKLMARNFFWRGVGVSTDVKI